MTAVAAVSRAPGPFERHFLAAHFLRQYSVRSELEDSRSVSTNHGSSYVANQQGHVGCTARQLQGAFV